MTVTETFTSHTFTGVAPAVGSAVFGTADPAVGLLQQRATREFLVEGPGINNEFQVLRQNGIPAINQRHPDNSILVVSQYDVSNTPEKSEAWIVIVTYKALAFFEFDVTGFQGILNVDVQGFFTDAWRTLPTIPGSLDQPDTGDISGFSIDSGGKAVSVVNYVVQLDITTRSTFADFTNIRFATNKRNLGDFFGAPGGFVLYKGATSTHIGSDAFETVHHFWYDDFAHLRQVVEIDPVDFRPRVDADGTASIVKFIQPYPQRTSFSVLV